MIRDSTAAAMLCKCFGGCAGIYLPLIFTCIHWVWVTVQAGRWRGVFGFRAARAPPGGTPGCSWRFAFRSSDS